MNAMLEISPDRTLDTDREFETLKESLLGTKA